VKTPDVCDPLIFGGEFNVVFFPLLVNTIHFYASPDDKPIMPANVAFLQEKLTSLYLSLRSPWSQQVDFVLVERNVFFEIRNEGLDHGKGLWDSFDKYIVFLFSLVNEERCCRKQKKGTPKDSLFNFRTVSLLQNPHLAVQVVVAGKLALNGSTVIGRIC